jgi:hypothetical protein
LEKRKKEKYKINHTPYFKGINVYFNKPLFERATIAIKEGRFWIGFSDWFDNNVFFYPITLYKKLKPTFKFNGKLYQYYLDKSDAATSERTVELPIAMDFYNSNKTTSFLEIGNTLNMHVKGLNHTVVDKYETAKGILNDDIADYNPKKKFKLIMSISTMEHVGFDEEPKDPKKIKKSMENILSLLDKDGKLLITAPIGYNPAIDEYVKSTKLTKRFMIKISSMNTWLEADENEAMKHTYNYRYKRDNAIVILTK